VKIKLWYIVVDVCEINLQDILWYNKIPYWLEQTPSFESFPQIKPHEAILAAYNAGE